MVSAPDCYISGPGFESGSGNLGVPSLEKKPLSKSEVGLRTKVLKQFDVTKTKKTPYTVKVVVVRLKHILRRSYLILWTTIYVFVILQYNLLVGAYFSLIG